MQNPADCFDDLRAVVRLILMHPLQYEWSLQGFGMLRLYLPNDRRLHVWSSDHAVEGVSTIHTHPWHFTSTVLSGQVEDVLYCNPPCVRIASRPYRVARILCGEGGGIEGDPAGRPTRLGTCARVVYLPGQQYRRRASDIHSSNPKPGTVTLVERKPLADCDHAEVYWPDGGDWVSAEPRRATPLEVAEITSAALEAW